MPIHDWPRVPSGLFHDFHQTWSIHIKAALNSGRLPKGFSALVEYADRANRIVVKHHLGRIVAVIEILSPGNKDSRSALRDFIDKTTSFMRKGAHLLIVDLFPPSPRDPLGIHKAIWDEIHEKDFAFPEGKDRIVASYEIGDEKFAYIEPIAVGDVLPEMPLFLATGMHIRVPLEATYQSAWDAAADDMRDAVETGLIAVVDTEEE